MTLAVNPTKIERTISFLPPGELPQPPIFYWSTRPYHERLAEVFTIVTAGKEKNMDIIADIMEMLALLNQHGVRYLVMGGYALGLHGHPRYTKDFDIWIERTAENLAKFEATLKAFGITLSAAGMDSFLAGQHFWIGKPPRALDFIGIPTGIEFSECYAARDFTILEKVEIPFISKKYFIQNKLASGRPQDLADVAHLNSI